MTHQFIYAPAQPPLESIFDGESQTWPTSLMVCRYCFEVQLHSHHPDLERPGGMSADWRTLTAAVRLVVANPGNGSTHCEGGMPVMSDICQAHNQKPDPDGVWGCYGELWVCSGCQRTVCAGFGCGDERPELCDTCWSCRRHSQEEEERPS